MPLDPKDIQLIREVLREELSGNEEILTLGEAAEFMKIGKTNLYDIYKTIPHFKEGRHIFFLKSSLIKRAKSKEVK